MDEKKARWLRYMPARANDNTVYVAVCNHVGDNGAGRTFSGVSFICDARGHVVAEASSGTEEQMVVADLKAADLAVVDGTHGFPPLGRPRTFHGILDT